MMMQNLFDVASCGGSREKERQVVAEWSQEAFVVVLVLFRGA